MSAMGGKASIAQFGRRRAGPELVQAAKRSAIRWTSPYPTGSLVGIRTLCLILQHLAGACVDSDFECFALALNVEGIAEAGTAALPFELLVGDYAGMCADCTSAGLRQLDLCHWKEFGSREMLEGRCRRATCRKQRGGCDANYGTHDDAPVF